MGDFQEKMTLRRIKKPRESGALKVLFFLLKTEHRAVQRAIAHRHISPRRRSGMARCRIEVALHLGRAVRFPEHFRQTRQ